MSFETGLRETYGNDAPQRLANIEPTDERRFTASPELREILETA